MDTKRTGIRGRLKTAGLVAVIGSLVAGCGANGGGEDGGSGSGDDPVQVAFFVAQLVALVTICLRQTG